MSDEPKPMNVCEITGCPSLIVESYTIMLIRGEAKMNGAATGLPVMQITRRLGPTGLARMEAALIRGMSPPSRRNPRGPRKPVVGDRDAKPKRRGRPRKVKPVEPLHPTSDVDGQTVINIG